MIPIFKKVMPYLGKLQEITDKINRNTREILIGMPVIKTFVMQDYEEKKFDKVNSEYNETNINAYRLLLLLTPLLTLHLSIMTVGIIYFGSLQIESGNLLIGDLLAFIQYATQILSAFLMVATFFTSMPDIIVSIKRVNEIFKTEVTIVDGEIESVTISDDETVSDEPEPEEVSPYIEIHAVNDVWMSVAFGNAQPFYRRTLKRGEVVRWDLTNYARVNFGRPSAAQVILNGKDLGIVNPSAKRAETYIYNPDGTFRRSGTR